MPWWLLVPAVLLLGVPAVLWVVGSLLPRDHMATVTVELRSPPERVWALIADFEGTARWRRDVQNVSLEARPGTAVRFLETSKSGTVGFEVVAQSAPLHQVVRVLDEDQPFGGTWTWELAPANGGTRLTITEAGFVKNPISRAIGRLFWSPTATIERYLEDLAAALDEAAS